MIWQVLGLAVASYLLGSIPFGVIVARSRGVDLFGYGSGSTGATNVFRALGRGPGLLVFALDVLKGLLPSLSALLLFGDAFVAFGIGFAAILGHSLSPWLSFRGGKGIATGLGVLLGSMPWLALSALSVFFLFAIPTRWISLGSIMAGLSLLPLGIVFGYPPPVWITLGGLGVFIIFRHKANVGRLLQGTESRFCWQGGTPLGEDRTDHKPLESDSPIETKAGKKESQHHA